MIDPHHTLAYQEGNDEEALNYFHQALEKYPHSAVTLRQMALIYIKRNDVVKAQELLRKSIQIDPFLIESRLNLAEIYHLQGRFPAAQRLYEDILAIDPSYETAYFRLVQLCLASGNFPRALELAQKILKESSDVSQLVNIGALLAQYQYKDLALAFFDKAVHSDPHDIRLKPLIEQAQNYLLTNSKK